MNHKNKTVVRSMDILNLFIDHPELTFQQIIDLSGMPKSSVYRMLMSLEEMGFLEKGEDLKYRLGLIFLKYGSLVSSRLDIRTIAYPVMKELHEDVEEAVNLIVQQGDEAVYIEKIDLMQKVRLYTAVGRKAPMYAGACSRVILSYLPEQYIVNYLENTEFTTLCTGTITDKQMQYDLIEQAKRDGYTVSHSELEMHTCSVAAPIFDHDGEVVAGLSLAGIEVNYTEADIAVFSEKVIDAANEISHRLGYQP